MKKAKVFLKRIGAIAMCLMLCLTVAVPALATGEDTGTQLEFNFEPSQMFTWTNLMLDAMMPVIYITLGISLCFIIVGALKSAFR